MATCIIEVFRCLVKCALFFENTAIDAPARLQLRVHRKRLLFYTPVNLFNPKKLHFEKQSLQISAGTNSHPITFISLQRLPPIYP